MWSTIILLVLIYIVSIGSLWDRVYIDTVIADWKKPPLHSIQIVNKDQDCPSEHENLAKFYWWGIKSGCTCTKGTKYSNVRAEKCTDKMIRDNCKTTPHRSAKWLEIVNGKRICGKRTVSSLQHMKKPLPYKYVKGSNGPVKCPKNYVLCGKATTGVHFSRVWCTPFGSVCPLTHIDIDQNMNVVTS